MSSYHIQIKRAYEPAQESDGYRILADRLWPRGVSKTKAALEEWDKNDAPSAELRKKFHEGAEDFETFRQDYFNELDHSSDAASLAQEVRDLLKSRNVTLVYSSKDPVHNNAVVLKEWLEKHL